MTLTLSDFWRMVQQSPLTGVVVTLGAYSVALWFNRRCHAHPLANPVLIGVLLLLAYLLISGSSYQQYMQGGQLIQLLLGPATVALAVPLYHHSARLRQAAGPLLCSIVLGGVVGIASSAGLAYMLGLPSEVVLSLYTRAVTTPIAMSVTQSIGGQPQLAAMSVITSGVLGAIIGKPLFDWLRLKDERALGVATGISAHGIGTARMFQLSETAGAFSSLAMGLNSVLTALLVPLCCLLWPLS